MLISCYLETGDEEGALGAARRTLERAEATTAKDPTNGAALAAGASSLMMLGEIDRGKDWLQRALILDPDNIMVLYNAASSLTFRNADLDGALDLLDTYFERLQSPGNLHHAEIDPDMDPVREHPRFKAMVGAARKRLGLEQPVQPVPGTA
jgi:adenylate cyclase